MWRTRPPGISSSCLATVRRTKAIRIAARASSVTSRAVDTCPGVSRPSGRTKFVCRRPSARAFAFINSAKAGYEPATWSASASAALFALWISAASTRSATAAGRPRAAGSTTRRRRSPAVDRDDVVEARVLEHDEHRHQLRDRRDRHLAVGSTRSEHLAGRRVLDHECRGGDVREPVGGRGRRGEGDGYDQRGEDEKPKLHAAHCRGALRLRGSCSAPGAGWSSCARTTRQTTPSALRDRSGRSLVDRSHVLPDLSATRQLSRRAASARHRATSS